MLNRFFLTAMVAIAFLVFNSPVLAKSEAARKAELQTRLQEVERKHNDPAGTISKAIGMIQPHLNAADVTAFKQEMQALYDEAASAIAEATTCLASTQKTCKGDIKKAERARRNRINAQRKKAKEPYEIYMAETSGLLR